MRILQLSRQHWFQGWPNHTFQQHCYKLKAITFQQSRQFVVTRNRVPSVVGQFGSRMNSLGLRGIALLQRWRPSTTYGMVGFLSVYCVSNKLRMSSPMVATAMCQTVSEVDSLSIETFGDVNQFSIFQKIRLTLRLAYLCVLFFPAVALYSLSSLFKRPTLSDLAWRYALFAIQIAGPAFIKLGQWASSRRDLFGEDFCLTLSQLHIWCDPHPWEGTVRTLEENLGKGWREHLVIAHHDPIGSGCVAQVYKGYLNSEAVRSENVVDGFDYSRSVENPYLANCRSSFNGPVDAERNGNISNAGTMDSSIPIAVKVLHPGIVESMQRDICLMKYAAGWADYVYPDLHWVALKECVDEFSKVMWKQLDLKLEAENLRKFQKLLQGHGSVKFPTPIQPYVTRNVLVESFEPGSHISEFMDKPGGRLQKNLARIGIKVLLDMLFIHNLVHGDLHPGNILVQDSCVEDPKMVLLDCGITTSLTPNDLENFRAVFTAIVTGDGRKVADLFLGSQQCANVEEYRSNMADLVDTGIRHLNLTETHVATLFSRLFNILIEHKVRIEPSYTSVMVAMMVIEGLGRSLDPSLDILAVVRTVLLQNLKQSLGFRKP